MKKYDLKSMTLKEKVGQMIGLAFSGTEYSNELSMQVEEIGAGLIIYFKDNDGSSFTVWSTISLVNSLDIVPWSSFL